MTEYEKRDDDVNTSKEVKGGEANNMGQTNETISKLKCERCGYAWFPRQQEKPETCPVCKSPYWDKPRKRGILAVENVTE